MGYIHAFLDYLRTPKGRHDLIDYLRAVVIIIATIIVVRSGIDIVGSWIRAWFN